MKSNPDNAETSLNQYDEMNYKTYAFGAVIVMLGAIGIFMMMIRPFGHPLLTIFFYSIPSNCAICIVPHDPVIVWYGKTINLWSLSIAASLGTLVASYIDYKFFTPILNLQYATKYKSHQIYKKCYRWFYRIPFISIAVAGFIPIIPFSPFKFMVYSSKYPLFKYIVAVIIGRFPRYLLLALLGYSFQIPNWLIAGSFLILLGMINYKRVFSRATRTYESVVRLLNIHRRRKGEKS